MSPFTPILQGCFTGARAILWLPRADEVSVIIVKTALHKTTAWHHKTATPVRKLLILGYSD